MENTFRKNCVEGHLLRVSVTLLTHNFVHFALAQDEHNMQRKL